MKKKRLYSILLVVILAIQLLGCDKAALTSYAVGKQKITLEQTSVVIPKDVSMSLKVVGTKKKVKWSSSNKKIASVSQKGKIKAKKTGSCYIKAKMGKKQLKCKVRVVNRYSEKQSLQLVKNYLKRRANKGGHHFNSKDYVWNIYEYKKNKFYVSYGVDSLEKVTWLGHYSVNAKTGKGLDEVLYEKVNFLQ